VINNDSRDILARRANQQIAVKRNPLTRYICAAQAFGSAGTAVSTSAAVARRGGPEADQSYQQARDCRLPAFRSTLPLLAPDESSRKP
jgi:hypothetical protein